LCLFDTPTATVAKKYNIYADASSWKQVARSRVVCSNKREQVPFTLFDQHGIFDPSRAIAGAHRHECCDGRPFENTANQQQHSNNKQRTKQHTNQNSTLTKENTQNTQNHGSH
jgi:hypothetical protein